MTPMTLEMFVHHAILCGLSTREEMKVFTECWRDGYESGEEGFGEETTLEDWTDGLSSFRCLCQLSELVRQS